MSSARASAFASFFSLRYKRMRSRVNINECGSLAIAFFSEILAFSYAWYYLGEVYLSEKQYDRAIAQF